MKRKWGKFSQALFQTSCFCRTELSLRASPFACGSYVNSRDFPKLANYSELNRSTLARSSTTFLTKSYHCRVSRRSTFIGITKKAKEVYWRYIWVFSADSSLPMKGHVRNTITLGNVLRCVFPFLKRSLSSVVTKLQYKDRHKTHYAFRRTSFRSASFKTYFEGKFVQTHNASCARLHTWDA